MSTSNYSRSAPLLALGVLALALVAWILRPSDRTASPPARAGPLPAAPPEPRSEPVPGPGTSAVPAPEEVPRAALSPANLNPHLAGTVVDELGHPWTSFRIRLRPVGDSLDGPRFPIEQIFERREDGSYAITDVASGRWLVSAESTSVSEEHEIRVAGVDVELHLVLPRPARVAGRVQDPGGAPVAGAEVRLLRRADARLGLRAESTIATDAEARFTVEVAAGTLVLQAAAAGYAPSAPLELELGPAEEHAELVLALRPGARIAGVVLDERGTPESGRGVWLSSLGGENGPTPTATSDERGTFAFEGLAPGAYELARVATRAEEARANGSAEEGRSLARLRKPLRIDLAEGETLEVVLGGASEPGVRLWGFVLDAPAERDTLFVEARAASDAARRPFSRIDESGGYELVLDAPGPHAVSVQDRGGVLLAVDVDVADLPSQRLDLEIGDAALVGQVVGPEGDLVAAAEVTLRARPDGDGPARAAASRRTTSDARGIFAFERLAPGTYVLAARAPRDMENLADAAAEVAGFEVAPHTRLEGVVIRLAPAAAIDVQVVGPTGPIAAAEVRVVDARGRTADARAARWTDAAGRTRVAGLPPGTWYVRALAPRLAGAWTGPINVGAGEAASVRLELRTGASLAVTVRGARAPGVWLGLHDERGIELARAFAAVRERTVATLGPLPLGRFTLRVEDPSGQTREQPVVVDSERTLAIDLDLGE